MPDARITRGMRNNNPGNIMSNPNNPWEGQTGQDKDGFAIFDTPAHGWRAMRKNLDTRIKRNPKETIATWIPRYASTSPPEEQDSYIEFLSNRLNADPRTPLRDLDPYSIIDAMGVLESHMGLTPETKEKVQHLLGGK